MNFNFQTNLGQNLNENQTNLEQQNNFTLNNSNSLVLKPGSKLELGTNLNSQENYKFNQNQNQNEINQENHLFGAEKVQNQEQNREKQAENEQNESQNQESEDFDTNKRYRTKRVLKVWTSEEDQLLVKYHKEYNGKWEQIAKLIQDRNASQCAQRYRRLNPTRIRSHWTPQEDEIVKKMVKKFGKNWGLLANNLEGRNGKQVRERYLNCLDPEIDWDPFDKTEDTIIWLFYKKIGPKWSEISKLLQGRPENMIKNRYYAHLKRIMNENPKKASQMDKLSFEEAQKSVQEYYIQKGKNKSQNIKQKQEYNEENDDETSVSGIKNAKRKHKQSKMDIKQERSHSESSSDSQSSSNNQKKKKKNKKSKKNKKDDDDQDSQEIKQHKKKKTKDLNLKIDKNDELNQFAYAPIFIPSPYIQDQLNLNRQSSLTPSQYRQFQYPVINGNYQILTPGPNSSRQNLNMHYQTVNIDGQNYIVQTPNQAQVFSFTPNLNKGQSTNHFNFNQGQDIQNLFVNTPFKMEGNDQFFGGSSNNNIENNNLSLKQKQSEFMMLPIQSCQKKEEQAFSFHNTEQAVPSQKNDSPQTSNGAGQNQEGSLKNLNTQIQNHTNSINNQNQKQLPNAHQNQFQFQTSNQNQANGNENGTPTLQTNTPQITNPQYLYLGKNNQQSFTNLYDEQYPTPTPQQRKDGFFPGQQFNFGNHDLANINLLGNNSLTPLQTCGSQKKFTFDQDIQDQFTPDLNYQQSNSFASFQPYLQHNNNNQAKSPQIQKLQQQNQQIQQPNQNSIAQLGEIKQQQQQQQNSTTQLQNLSLNLNNVQKQSQRSSHNEIKDQQDTISLKSNGSRKPNLALDINKIQNWQVGSPNQKFSQQQQQQQPKEEFVDEDDTINQIQSQMEYLQKQLELYKQRKNANKK
ncbi:Homeodomain protein [Pseudocohnilembus persalinus]|uniref:Homeodomain protein n=1 Tax=Pseudocohnilembus persalinus TaxID=266149 RepID=A0A0V0R4G8_PSEPJ|nr:Homeodomain protein [Pseudocohnilembus persalinus]|eukprot:KRX09112.1 Homeodomain protein [Pseudocohnilembus persalinus]